MAAGTMREAILANLVTVIDAITTPTHTTDIRLATRLYRSPPSFQTSELPAVVILPGAETREQGQEVAPAGQFRSFFRVGLRVIQEVTRSSEEDAGLAVGFEEIIEDIHKAIMVDESRGVTVGTGQVEETFLEEVSEPFIDENNLRLDFWCMAKVTYRENRATP